MNILALYGLLIVATIAVQAAFTLPKLGLGYLVGPRDEAKDAGLIAARLSRTTKNSVTAFAYFAPAVLLLQAQGPDSGAATTAAWVFLVARIAYVPLYAAGIPWLRTAAWTVALLAALDLYWMAL